ncbi:MAG: sel1 repeat family protein [Bacteroidales bacterium]|nr:sel1 repeat family protein [Bacteroidales bacterium]
MKKSFFLCAIALMMVACGQQDNTKQEQTETKKVVFPQGMPVAPTPQIPPTGEITLNPNGGSRDPNAPVLKIEEGKPLDLSQLTGGRKSLGDQAAERIDSIRFYAEQGKANFQFLYAACLENGWGVDENYAQALAWYKKAADQKQKDSYNAIGNLYRMGKGVKADASEAFKWFKLGAEAEDAQAMLNLGNCHYFGMGTGKSIEEAVRWWRQSADGGNAYAKAQMGDCYYYGMGAEKDLETAIDYYTQAADKNVAGAQYRLGILYYSGQGVKQDRAYSKLLLTKARDGGMREAQDFLDKNFKE